MIEIERTYLVKDCPKKIKDQSFQEIIDIYIPKNIEHPDLRIRKHGDKYSITRKSSTNSKDFSEQEENIIVLHKKEFEAFSSIEGKRIRKLRYLYSQDHFIAEIDVFQDDLKGLISVDFEFENTIERDIFVAPDFCLAEVTQEEFIAGGMLAGKSYDDIKDKLEEYGYKKQEF